jgi:hypothetical protein
MRVLIKYHNNIQIAILLDTPEYQFYITVKLDHNTNQDILMSGIVEWARVKEENMTKLSKSKKKIIEKSEELGIKYEAKYKACGPCTFLAIVDALRWGGLEIMDQDIEDRFFSGTCVLTAGVAMTGDGTCGAVASSAMAIASALSIPRERPIENSLRSACASVRNTILEKYYQEYRSILCKDVQRKFFGRAWDLARDDMSHEFLKITRGCTILQTAKWTTEIILNEFEKGNVNITPIA